MALKFRKGCGSGTILFHRPAPPPLLQSPTSRSVRQRPVSMAGTDRSCPYIRSGTQRSARTVTHFEITPDREPVTPPCSKKQLQEQFLSEQKEAEAIIQPLLDTENGFIKELELYLDHWEAVSLRKRELLHKRWTEQVWRPVQQNIERHFARSYCEGAEPMTHCNSKVSTSAFKDPLSLQSRVRMRENRTPLLCQTGRVSNHQQEVEKGRETVGLQRTSRSRAIVYLAAAEGRCFRPECWSFVGHLRDHPARSDL